jgi:hypothetical protein
MDKMHAGLCKERGREVMARLGAAAKQACACTAQSAVRAATGAVKGTRGWEFCLYAGVGMVS